MSDVSSDSVVDGSIIEMYGSSVVSVISESVVFFVFFVFFVSSDFPQPESAKTIDIESRTASAFFIPQTSCKTLFIPEFFPM